LLSVIGCNNRWAIARFETLISYSLDSLVNVWLCYLNSLKLFILQVQSVNNINSICRF
jgi:hypothetical protein